MKKNIKKYLNFTDRIKFICEKFGSVARLANETGISVTAINKYRNGLSDPSRTNLIALANAVQVDVGWLATGKGNKETINQNTSYVSIPISNTEASAGNGIYVNHEEVNDFMQLNETWLRSTFHINPSSVTILPVNGDSMEPTIRSGELVLITKSNISDKLNDGIYLIRVDDSISVKRLQFLPKNEINISSDNKLFPPYKIRLNDGTDFAVLGRVLAGFRTL